MSDFNQAPVVPDSPSISTDEQTAVTINPALAVSDPDLDARNGGNGDYSGAAFTISRASASADDLFGFAADGAGFTVNGANLEVGGNVFASFVQSGGSLTINFTSSGAIATTALVNSVLEHLQYTNTSDEPPASVTLTYSLDDGAPANAAQGTVVNGNNIDSGEVTVSINAIDDGIAQNDEFTTDELTLVTGNVFVDNGSGPDSDPNGLTIVAVNGAAANVGSQITTGSGALLTVNADGSFSYDPNGAFEQTPTFDSGATNTPAADTFSYTLAGGQTATAVITIDGVDNNDLVFGSDGADVLTGGVGDDSLFGLDGDDLIRGRVGDDYIDGGDGFDRAGYYHTDEQAGGVHVDLTITGPQDTGSQGVDTLTSIEYVSGTPFADVLIGDDNDNVLWGSVATIDPGNWVSTSNNDTLDGGGGNDLLYVGIGNHSLTGGDGTDTVGFTENFGDDPAIHVSLALQGQAQDTGQGLWTLNGIENLSGGDDNDELTGDDNDNILAGSAGNDVLSGGGGNDQLYGDGLFDTSAPASGAPTLYPDTGANGNDVLEGGTGDDELYGGGGVDTASYEHASGGVQVVLYKNGGGAGDSTGADGEDLLSGIENLTGSAYDDILIGNNLDNVLSGGDGIDLLRGFAGNDTLQGGAGDDYLDGGIGDDILDGGDGWDRLSYFGSATGPVTVDLRIQGVAQDTGQGNDTLIGIEHVGGTVYGDTLTGDDGDNVIRGASDGFGSPVDHIDGQGGNDLISDGAGDHVLDGGAGTDTYLYEWVAVQSGINVSLALQGGAQDTGVGNLTLSNFENVTGTTFTDQLTGDGNANVLAGDLGDDVLSGGAGNDALYGDGRFYMDTHNSGLSGPIAFVNDSTSMYVGGVSGNDVLEGGLGDDLIDGGGGTDTASYLHASGGVTVDLSTGSATGADGNDTLISIENVTGSAFGDSITGNFASNILDGRDGDDLIIARGGDDSLYGGNGNDFLSAGPGNDLINGGDGFDRAAFSQGATSGVTVDLRIQGVAQNTGIGSDTLIGIEYLSGSVFGDVLTGDDNNNYIWGVSDSSFPTGDTIDGQGGDDLIEVGAGDHILTGGTGNDTLLYNPFGTGSTGATISLALQGAAQDTGAGSMTLNGFENLSGGDFGDTLIGDSDNNVLGGGLGDDTLVGGAGNDSLYGDGILSLDSPNGGSGPITFFSDVGVTFGVTDGNDTLEGGLGNDLIDGGGGIDTASYAHASGGVTVSLGAGGSGTSSGADGNDTLAGIENLTGSAFNDALNGNGLANVLTGGDGHDSLRGNGGDDTLYGGAGDDFLYGNAGNDTIDGGEGFDRAAFFSGATAGVTVDLRIVGAQNTGQGTDTLVNIEAVSGTAFTDTLIGDDGSNWLAGQSDGGSNADTIQGNGGDDLITDGIGDHILDGGSGNDVFALSSQLVANGLTISLTLQGAAQNTGAGNMNLTNFESLSGTIFSDIFTGDGNANVLAGDLGDDTLSGGAGNDSLYGDGAYKIDTHGTGGSGPITFYGDATSLYVGGMAGNDTLEGGLGNDLIDGGGGIDTASYAHAGGGVTVDLGSGYAEGADGNDTLVSIENIIGSNFDDDITGDGGANVIDGLGGNDFIAGGAGDDTVHGGDGNDFIQGEFGENNISVSGNDTLYGDAGDDQIRGGLGNDFLYGGSGNDLLRGNGGVDYFDGGADDGLGFNGVGDRVSFYELRATQGVIADLRTGIISNDGFGNVETMVNIESLGAGTAYADIFYGNDGRNFLAADVGDQAYGFGGDDAFQLVSAPAIVDGGTGTDKLYLYIATIIAPDSNGDGLAETIAAATSGFIVNLNTGVITDGYGNSGSITGIENIDGTSLGDTLTGDANANVLNGLDGNDTLEGGLGNDTLDGGNGTDTASYAHASGAVTVDLGAGTATGADGSDTLTNIENATGSAFGDILNGNGQDNVLDGGDGNDNLAGGGGADTLYGGNGNDGLNGGGGNDSLYAGAGNDFLTGGFGDDVIDGGDGFDRVSNFSGATTGVTVDLRQQGVAQYIGEQGWDTLINIEAVSGTAFGDTLTGDNNANWLWGSAAGGAITNNDILDGQGGDDLLQIGIGNHSLTGGTGIDTVSFSENGGAEPDINVSLALQGGPQTTGAGSWTISGVENLSGGRGNDVLTGDGGNNVLAGFLGNDTLVGGMGDDTLYGDGVIGADTRPTGGSGPITTFTDAIQFDASYVDGNDILEGGLGNDTLNGGGGIDTASYAHASGAVTATIGAGGSGSSSGADGIDTFVSIENLTGGAFNDSLNGNGQVNVIDGGAGHDKIFGNAGNDVLLGNAGDDSLAGGTGDDVIDGGSGFDRAAYFGSTVGVTVNLNNQGVAQNTGWGNDTLIGIENLTGTQFADTLTGDANDNWIWGFTWSVAGGAVTNNDILDGGGGNDLIWAGRGDQILIGGTGIDTLMYNENFSSDQSVTISLALQGTSQITGQGSWNLTGFENLIGGNANDTLTGDGNDNVIGGGIGSDLLVGGAGNDTLYGDGEITFDDHGTGGSGPIITIADAGLYFGRPDGNDTLEGGLGNDTIDGGDGIDTASYANASGSVVVTLTGGGAGSSSGADGNDTLSNIENLTGGGFNDSLTGDAGANVLDGGAGSDFIIGGLGDDTIIGGAGVDRAGYYQTNAALGGVTVNLAAGTASGSGGNDTLSGIENVSGTAFADTLTGDSGNNWLWGSAATYQSGASTIVSTTNNDRLDGGAGNDLLTVGKGNQTLIGGTGNDTVRFTENGAAESNLTVSLANTGAQNTGNGTWTLSGVENLSGGVGNDNLTGDDNANVLAGDSGADILSGGLGADTLYGDGLINVDGNGVTTIYGDGAATAGADNLSGGDGDDFLYGGGGNDVLKGDKDNDTLYGGTGNDTMTGGNGNDRYVIEANSGADTISGFAHVDKIVFDISSGVTSMTQLTMTKVGGTNTLISWGNGNSIMVSGFKPTDFLASDFQFMTAAGFEHSPHDFSAAVTAPSVPHDVFL